ncbi:MAG: Rne/Rng family ribonuclease [Desulfovibrionaceae bacterium]|nr:Rne/Rng family ribonuclease [Desulfovibrionaceae bacterium]
MFFSIFAGERIEVALTERGKLCEYYLDMEHQEKLKGNIYKGIIQNIDVNLQAAFVNYGNMKNGFLQMDEIHPEYWLEYYEPTRTNRCPPIQKAIKPGQEVLVQVVKEPNGAKGAFLTTKLSLAGRFLVLTPGQEQVGVSRKVVDESERARLKELIAGINPGPDMGVIVRTVSEGTTKETLTADLMYLKRIWNDIRRKATEVAAPAQLYHEPGLIERALRDYLTYDVTEIWVDDVEVEKKVRSLVEMLLPQRQNIVRLYSDNKRMPMWDRFNLRRQIDQVYSREVFLPSGGRLVFDQTEALLAIDVNSGKISCRGNFESMAYKTNMEAAESIAQQLRLRDVGGQVVIDFIEMRDRNHVEEVERTLRQAMKLDRARHDILRMSTFGLLELVRQRTGFSALSIIQEPCPFCGGTGQRRNLEWQALTISNDIQRRMRATKDQTCVYEVPAELGMYLLNSKREMLQELEAEFGKKLEIRVKYNV